MLIKNRRWQKSPKQKTKGAGILQKQYHFYKNLQVPSEKTKRKKNKHLKAFIVHKSTHKLDDPYSMTDLLFFPEIFLLKDMHTSLRITSL